MSLSVSLFLCFLQVGLLSIGGGYAAMPIIQSQVVEKYGWLTMSEFTDLITIAEMTPGPIAVNSATFVGIRILGIPGALIATIGCILPSCFIVTFLAMIYYKYRTLKAMQIILSFLRPVVVALIASAGVSILLNVLFYGQDITLKHLDMIALTLFPICFIAIRYFKKSPILSMLTCGIVYTVITVLL